MLEELTSSCPVWNRALILLSAFEMLARGDQIPIPFNIFDQDDAAPA